jgi:hypothetical protein
MFDDEDDCDDRCPDCNRIDCWGCDGFTGGGVEWVWYDEPPARRDYARVRRRLAAKRRRAGQHHAALARFGQRLQRAIRAAWLRRHPGPHAASCSCNDCVPF